MSRAHLERAHGWKYRPQEDEKAGVCYYCNASADSYDHVPPLCRVEIMEQSGTKFHAVRVPACRHCNSLAGAFPHTSLLERKAYVKGKLRRRFEKLKRALEWSETDLLEFGDNIRSLIVRDRAIARNIQMRIAA